MGGSTSQVSRYQLAETLSNAVPRLLLLSATPHRGKSDHFRRVLRLLDADAFEGEGMPEIKEIEPYVLRSEKRNAVDYNGEPLFRERTTTKMLVPMDEERHRLQLALYDHLTNYVRTAFNKAKRTHNPAIALVMTLFQKIASSSTAAIMSALSTRLYRLQNGLDDELSNYLDDGGEDEDTLNPESFTIEQNADGSPKSPIHLTNAMNDGQEIYLWEINELLDDDAPPISDEDLKSYKDTLKKAQKIFNAVPFNQKIIFPLKNLSKTLRSNLRAEELPNNAKEVDHSTILFLTYFFICGCYNLKSVELNDLSLKLDTEIKNNVDDAVGNNLRYALKSVINNIEDAKDFGQLQTYVNSLDTLLESFHCSKFYPPFLVDRCVLLCLLKVRRQKNVDDFPKYLMAQLIEVSCEFSKKILKESKKISKEVT